MLKQENAIISKNLEIAFESAEPWEERLGRDLCEWTSGEIIDFYKFYSTASIQTLVILHNYLTDYARWCLSNGLISNGQNHYDEIKTEALCKCVDTETLSNVVVTREELLSEIKDLPNTTDQFIFLGLFEGITMKDGALYKVKPSDLDGNTLRLPNGKSIQISPELSHIIHMATEETDYITMGKRGKSYPYVDGEEIVRPIIYRKNQQFEENETIMIGTRMRKCVKYLGMSPSTTMKSIIESGRIHYIKETARRNNINPTDIINTPDYRIPMEERFGKIQNLTSYLQLYGNLMMD